MRTVTPILLLFVSSTALADSAFDGTWQTDLKTVGMTGKPDVYLLANGEYICSSCSPELQVKADGVEHAVTGHPYYDSATVKVTGPNSDDVVLKKRGKEFAHLTDTVTADGNTLTTKFVNHVGEREVTGEVTEKRVAAGPSGSHPVSGSWRQLGFDANDAARTVQYRASADGFQMQWNGQSYDAKFDGKEYPVKGDPGKTTVVLKQIDAQTIEEIDHRAGKIVDEIRMTVAKDGKTIAFRDKDVAHGQTTTYTLIKQS